jgi:phosphoserine phosphatase RsbU/P
MGSDISLSPEVMAIAAIACPVRSDSQALDVLYVVMPPECGTSEWLALAALATKQYQQSELVIAAREHAAVERELKKAMEIQSRLVPRNPALTGIELAIGFKPCRWVGGDYVDAVKTADGRTLLVMADVCGKGLPAALVASMLHTTVRVGVKAGMDLTQMMQNLNEYLRESMFEQSFVTMVSILADPASGEVECVNAGHPPAVLIDASGKMRALQTGANLPLGVGDEALESNRDVIAPGELLVLYTDGLADLADECGQRLGSERLSRQLCELYAKEHGQSVSVIGQRVTEMLDAYQGETVSPDDRTFLLGRRVTIA